MPSYVREDICGTTPQDLNKINMNNMAIWQKVFGDINFSDTDKDLKKEYVLNIYKYKEKEILIYVIRCG